ncbi:MAG TPA: ABC transporter ATP-binding protein [Chthoniobacterales bacterium]
MSGPLLQVNGAGRRYGDLTVLSGVNFALATGETCAILGPSGSGKSTLLALCAGLDAASEGDILLDGRNLAALSEDERAALRVDRVGFVFQNFQLLPTLTALENVMVPAELLGKKDARSRAAELLGRVGLGGRLGHYPNQLSGGEQQRVAIARAFINEPALLFADEPTGNLDFETGHRIVEMLFDLNREQGTALLLVTHDLELAGRTGRVIRLRGGKVET